jgi:hypothetical protein
MESPPESAESVSYDFADLSRARRPTAVQYTPEYDPDWLYPTGTKAGGTRDDVPVQGLELGVLARETDLLGTVEATARGLESYYERLGHYPRHRIVADADSFRARATDGTGLVATVQARTTAHDGLTDHFRAVREATEPDTLVAPNFEPTLRLAVHLAGALAARGPRFARTDGAPRADEFRQVADTRLFERYAPLGASGLYDTAGGVDFEHPDAETADELSFTPASLGIDGRQVLETAAVHVTSADELLGIVDRG